METHIPAHADAELRQELLADRPDRHAGGGLTRRSALQRRAQILIAILDRPGQVGVPGTRGGEGCNRPAAPFGMVAVLD